MSLRYLLHNISYLVVPKSRCDKENIQYYNIIILQYYNNNNLFQTLQIHTYNVSIELNNNNANYMQGVAVQGQSYIVYNSEIHRLRQTVNRSAYNTGTGIYVVSGKHATSTTSHRKPV